MISKIPKGQPPNINDIQQEIEELAIKIQAATGRKKEIYKTRMGKLQRLKTQLENKL